MNEHCEFVDDFDPYLDDERRRRVYAGLAEIEVEKEEPRRCPMCGKDMSGSRSDAVYCSKRCRNAARYVEVTWKARGRARGAGANTRGGTGRRGTAPTDADGPTTT